MQSGGLQTYSRYQTVETAQDVASKPQDEVGERQNTTGVQEKGTQISGPQGRKAGVWRQAAAKEGKKDIIKCNEQL